VLLLGLGAATLTSGSGLPGGKKWPWWFATGLFVINGFGDVVSFIAIRDAVRSASGILIRSVFTFLLDPSLPYARVPTRLRRIILWQPLTDAD
jgi:hypothetical protein